MNCFHCKQVINVDGDWYFHIGIKEEIYIHYICFADFAGIDFVNRWGEFPNHCLICDEIIVTMNKSIVGELRTTPITMLKESQCIHIDCWKEAAGL